MAEIVILLGIMIAICVIVWCFFGKSKKENYGPVKNLKRVPKNNCYEGCKQYYTGCMARYQYVDASDCWRRFDQCINACNYSDFHRM